MSGLERKIAASLDLPAALAPHAARLLEGVDALGSQPLRTAKLLQGCGVDSSFHLLDLACGKGAVSVATAARTGCRVTGVDASGAFLERARELAANAGVAARWVEHDVGTVRTRQKFDCVIMLNLFPAARAVAACRPFVRRGGLILVDDVALVRRGRARSRVWPSADELAGQLATTGLELVRIEQCCRPSVERHAARIERRVRRNGQRLVTERPVLRKALAEFLKRLGASSRLLAGPIRPTLFVLRRVG